MATKFTLQPDTVDERDYLFSAAITPTASAPESVDLRSKMPPIENQGDIGSCQSFASGAIKEYLDRCAYTISKLFVYYNARPNKSMDTGSTLRDVLKGLNKFGACENKYWDYAPYKFTITPPKAAYDNAKSHTITEYHRLTTHNEIKQALSIGLPILIGVKVFESFEKVGVDGIVPMPLETENYLGGHAVVICGYKNTKQNVIQTLWTKLTNKPASKGYYIVRNSWSTEYGDRGYMYIPYEVFDKIIMDMWVITK